MSSPRNAALGTIAILVSCFALLAGALGYVIHVSLPDVSKMKSCLITELYSISLCPGSSNYSRLSEVSEKFITELIMTEDASFYSHSGFDFSEISESFEKNLEEKKYARGASTITQQLAKNVFLTSEKTLIRKFREALIAARIESLFTKNEILERYINVVEFGPKIFGIRKASSHYFGKSPSELNWAESAFLVHLLPNPTVYAQGFNKRELTAFNKKRINDIIDSLYRYKKISEEEFSQANFDRENFFSQFTLSQESFADPASGEESDDGDQQEEEQEVEETPTVSPDEDVPSEVDPVLER